MYYVCQIMYECELTMRDTPTPCIRKKKINSYNQKYVICATTNKRLNKTGKKSI